VAEHRMNLRDWLRKQLEEADSDLLRDMVQTFAEQLMDAQVEEMCGAGYRERSEERTNSRNGVRERRWDTRAGTIDLAIPKLRNGSYFPSWLLEPRQRAERALIQVVAQSYLEGVSSRKVSKLVKKMGIEGISRSQASRMARELDEDVTQFRGRPLEGAPYTYVWVDAHAQKVREGGRVVSVATVVAIGVNAEGTREVLGFDVFTEESEANWAAFLRELVERGLTGVQLVISDAHKGLVNAIAREMPGSGWQRCRTHFMRNLLGRIPRNAQKEVGDRVRTIFAQPDARSVREQFARIVEELEDGYPEAAALLTEAEEELLAFAVFPKQHWIKIWSNNPLERLNREIRRRTDVVGIFPERPAGIRLIGALLVEQNDEWIAMRRYMSRESLMRARLTVVDGEQEASVAEMVVVG
jgi:putative transposase